MSSAYDVLPPSRIRRVTARKMLEVVAAKPHVTLHARADARKLLAAREKFAREGERERGARITMTVLLASLVVRSLREFPRMNGRTELGEVRLYHDVNLGVAVEVDDGLVVPVIRDSETRRMRTLATKLADLTARARSRDLTPLDMTDGTFTISNLGALGVEFFTPIINPPELGILGVGSLRDEVKIVGGEPQEVPTLHLSLSFDHAALDGADSARFLQLVVRHVECPESGWPDSEAVTTT